MPVMRDRRVFLSATTAAVLLGSIVVMTQAPAPDPMELVKQGKKLNAEGHQAEAVAQYEQALALAPTLFDAHLGAGIALDLQGRYADARRHLTRAIEFMPPAAKEQAFEALGVSYAFEANAREAAPYYQQLFDAQMDEAKFGGAAGTANALGRIYLESGDTDNALKWYQTGYETLRREPDMPGPELDLWMMRWEHAQASIAARRGRQAEAQQHLAAAQKILEKGTNTGQGPTVQYLKGYLAFYAHDDAAAIRELLQADLLDPFILGLLGRAYDRAGDVAHAREYFTRVLESNAHNIQNAFARPVAQVWLRAH
jgi:tetratricopeptide (TPR) repeat protein